MSITFDRLDSKPRLELIPDSKLRRLIGKSPRTIGRWDDDPESDFPKPITINRRKHRRLADVEAWLKKCGLPPVANGEGA